MRIATVKCTYVCYHCCFGQYKKTSPPRDMTGGKWLITVLEYFYSEFIFTYIPWVTDFGEDC